jgi:hypothetical protein
MSLMGPKSMSKVDALSLIIIDFYVPALTPRLNSTETSLQLSETPRTKEPGTVSSVPTTCIPC